MHEKIQNAQRPLIYILESPSASDVYSGTSEGELLSRLLDLLGLNYLHRNVANLDTFKHALADGLAEDCQRLGKHPLILHLSCHGNKDGIGLTSGEDVPWAQLRELVAPLNTAADGALLLCMSSCEGWHAWEMCLTMDSPPFFGVVGTTEAISWPEAAVGYAVLYHQLELGRNPLQALEAIRLASGNSSFRAELGDTVQKKVQLKLEEELARRRNLQPSEARGT